MDDITAKYFFQQVLLNTAGVNGILHVMEKNGAKLLENCVIWREIDEKMSQVRGETRNEASKIVKASREMGEWSNMTGVDPKTNGTSGKKKCDIL